MAIRKELNGILITHPNGILPWFIIDSGKRRGLQSGADRDRLLHADYHLELSPDIVQIDEGDPWPAGVRLICDPTGIVCVQEVNRKRYVSATTMIQFQFDPAKVVPVGTAAFDAIPTGMPIEERDILSLDSTRFAVENQSDHTIYVKPENSSGAVPVPPGGVYADRFDGISAPHIRSGHVFKTVDYVGATVTNGQIETHVPLLRNFETFQTVRGGEWRATPPDEGWNALFATNPPSATGDGRDLPDRDWGQGDQGGVIHDAPRRDRDDVGKIG